MLRQKISKRGSRGAGRQGRRGVKARLSPRRTRERGDQGVKGRPALVVRAGRQVPNGPAGRQRAGRRVSGPGLGLQAAGRKASRARSGPPVNLATRGTRRAAVPTGEQGAKGVQGSHVVRVRGEQAPSARWGFRGEWSAGERGVRGVQVYGRAPVCPAPRGAVFIAKPVRHRETRDCRVSWASL